MAAVPGLPTLLYFVIAAVIFSGAIVFSFLHQLPVERGTGEKEAVFRLPERSLWIIGAIEFYAVIGEGAMADWSGVYLMKVLNAKAASLAHLARMNYIPKAYAASKEMCDLRQLLRFRERMINQLRNTVN